MNKNQYEQDIKILKTKEYIYRFLSLLLIIAILVIFVFQWKKDNDRFPFFKSHNTAPYADEVYKIINNLQYSGLERFEKKDVFLSLDFENKIWVLHNIHKFDNAGNVVLEKGRYGTCGELAAYTYEHIKSLLDKEYDIKFCRAIQSGYFLTPKATHIILFITKKRGLLTKGDIIFILDPSFNRYGPIDEFEDYMFLEEMTTLPFVDNKETGVTMLVSESIPLLIKDNRLLGFTVEENYGKFDKQNFVVALTITKKNRYAGRYLFAIRNNNGKVETLEDKNLGIPENIYKKLQDKVILMFDNILQQ